MNKTVKKILSTMHQAGVVFNVNADTKSVEVRYTTPQDKLVTSNIPALWFESPYLACFSLLEIPELVANLEPKYLKMLHTHVSAGAGK